LEPDDAPDASDRGARTLGFTGTVPLQETATAAGLATLEHDAFGGAPRMPMVPGTWINQSGPSPG
jgi:hypothetical protein